MAYFTLKDFNFSGKRVIVRVDFNVPIDEKGKVTDDKRIREALPTIKYLIENKAIVILMSHLGRPDGKVVEGLRMGNAAKSLEKLLGRKVLKLDDCIGTKVKVLTKALSPGDVAMLENLRFYPQEEGNDEGFAVQLAGLADFYVNDAFGTCHRPHASVEAITKHLPSCAGFLLEKELRVMGGALSSPERPFVAVMGGAKVSDKIEIIRNLLGKVDRLLIGGAMMFTFLKAKGYETGSSLVENDKIELAKELLKDSKIVLPVDTIAGDKLDKDADAKAVGVDSIAGIGLDIGPKTMEMYAGIIKKAKTVIWNGPMGKFEWKKFSKGTEAVAKAMASSNAVTIIGGGDSAAAVEKLRLGKKMTHISTGGGASLEFLSGKKLPAIAALEKNCEDFVSGRK